MFLECVGARSTLRELRVWIEDDQFHWHEVPSEFFVNSIRSLSIRARGPWRRRLSWENSLQSMERLACCLLEARIGKGLDEFIFDSPVISHPVNHLILAVQPCRVSLLDDCFVSPSDVLHANLRSLRVDSVVSERTLLETCRRPFDT